MMGRAPCGALVARGFGAGNHKERAVNVKAVAFCALVMMTGPAAAQSWGPYGPGGYVSDAVSLYEIQATLRANGLRPITRPVQSWPYIVVRAVDPYGDVVRVLLNARYGNIVSVLPLPPAPVIGERPYRPNGPYPYRPYEPRYGDLRPDLKSEPAPVGPSGPYTGSNAQEDRNAQEHRSAAITAARPPMPRPRPAIKEVAAAAKPAPEP